MELTRAKHFIVLLLLSCFIAGQWTNVHLHAADHHSHDGTHHTHNATIHSHDAGSHHDSIDSPQHASAEHHGIELDPEFIASCKICKKKGADSYLVYFAADSTKNFIYSASFRYDAIQLSYISYSTIRQRAPPNLI